MGGTDRQARRLVLPRRQALAGLDFNKIWTNCICGNDGKPISDGPFILTNYTNGQGSTFKVTVPIHVAPINTEVGREAAQ